MTDMTAFERQLSGEILDLMGPVRPVDDAAVFAAITATHSAQWAIRPTFGATRFVLGTIVVLLGVLLLTEVLTRPSDVAQPAASPSALPSEEIEPGVSRILVDGFVNRISVGPDGSVWRVDDEDAKSVLPLQGSPAPDAPFDASMIEVGPDGVVWVAGPSGVASWDGLEWTAWSAPPGQQPLAVLPAPDGAALVPWFDEGGGQAEGYANARMSVDRLTGDGARDPGEPLTLDVRGDLETPNDLHLAFASTSDGDVWAVTQDGARDAAGDDGHLWRWDGRIWRAETGPGVDGDIRPRDVAVGADGSVWLYLTDGGYYAGGARLLARLQDDEWTVWSQGDGVPFNAYRVKPLMTVGHDGAVWVPTGACWPEPGLAMFDGVTSSSYLADWCIYDMAAAPDGSIWATGFLTEGADVGLFRVIRVEDDEAGPGAVPSSDGSPDTGG